MGPAGPIGMQRSERRIGAVYAVHLVYITGVPISIQCSTTKLSVVLLS